VSGHGDSRRSLASSVAGFSLVELMIALVLGLIVLAGVGSVFLANKQTYATNEALARVQDAVRTAHAFLGNEVRVAGYGGTCAIDGLPIRVLATSPAPDPDAFGIDATAGIAALVGSVAGAGERVGSIEVPEGSSLLTVRHFPVASDTIGPLAGRLDVTNANVQIRHNRPGFEKGDLAMITDCVQADVFRVTNRPGSPGSTTLAHASSGNADNALSREYGRDAFVFRMDDYRSTTFFVGRNPQGGQSLYQRINDRPAIELVRGVEDMRLGYHRAGGAADYERAVNGWSTADWAEVDGLRLELVLADAAGRRGVDGRPLSRSLTAVFALRNRMDQ